MQVGQPAGVSPWDTPRGDPTAATFIHRPVGSLTVARSASGRVGAVPSRSPERHLRPRTQVNELVIPDAPESAGREERGR